MKKATFSVAVMRPFRLDLTAWVMRRRKQNTISRWDGQTYQRVLAINDIPVRMSAVQGGTPNSPRLLITLESHRELTLDEQVEAQLVTHKMLGTSVNLQQFSGRIAQDPVMWSLLGPFIGARPTRFPTMFEALISAVACQQIPRDVGIELLNNVTETYGLAFVDKVGTMHAFPRPEDLQTVTESDLVSLGFSTDKAQAIVGLTAGVVDESINLEQLELATNDEALEYLKELPGVSKWAAEYVLVRGLGRLDVFPGDEAVVTSELQQVLALKYEPDNEKLRVLTAAWHPYEGFVYLNLLLEYLFRRNLV